MFASLWSLIGLFLAWLTGMRSIGRNGGRIRERICFSFLLLWSYTLMMPGTIPFPTVTTESIENWLYRPIGLWIEHWLRP